MNREEATLLVLTILNLTSEERQITTERELARRRIKAEYESLFRVDRVCAVK